MQEPKDKTSVEQKKNEIKKKRKEITKIGSATELLDVHTVLCTSAFSGACLVSMDAREGGSIDHQLAYSKRETERKIQAQNQWFFPLRWPVSLFSSPSKALARTSKQTNKTKQAQ